MWVYIDINILGFKNKIMKIFVLSCFIYECHIFIPGADLEDIIYSGSNKHIDPENYWIRTLGWYFI